MLCRAKEDIKGVVFPLGGRCGCVRQHGCMLITVTADTYLCLLWARLGAHGKTLLPVLCYSRGN